MKRFIVLFSAVILCLTLAGCSGSQYKKATELYEQGNYAEAGEIFSKLGNYEDSADKANECKYQEASAFLQNSDYDAAKELFSALGDYGDSADKVKFCDYKKAEKLLADDDYDAVKAIFSTLGSYENSFHFSSFISDTPYVFVCPPENKKSSGTSSISPRTRGSAALPFMRKISHPSLFFG